MVDTLGLILTLVVHTANIQDRDGAKLVFKKAKKQGLFKTLKCIWADGGYAGKLIAWMHRYCFGCVLEIIKRTDAMVGFVLLPKRWVVERTFSWFGKYRRLSKDYEEKMPHSEAMIYLSMTHIMARRW